MRVICSRNRYKFVGLDNGGNGGERQLGHGGYSCKVDDNLQKADRRLISRKFRFVFVYICGRMPRAKLIQST